MTPRQLMGIPVAEYLAKEKAAAFKKNHPGDWRLTFKENFVYDRDGLALVLKAVREYRGDARELRFVLKTDALTYRDYYSLQPDMELPLAASRTHGTGCELLDLNLPSDAFPVPFPESLCPATDGMQPRGLLMPWRTDFDLLFANQIALPLELKRAILKSPFTWIKAFLPYGGQKFRNRLALRFSKIHPSAQVHPTAVIEGSWIGPGARIGAHCVVRYSHIGAEVRLHDGAKVELSVVGAGSWLMHDLVLYRSHAEDRVFLIHGPYQFSSFQSGSSAFATIMMDYRPDGKSIRVGSGRYAGRFLGAVLKPGSKTLGGSLLAPGQIVPENVWLAADSAAIHRIRDGHPYPKLQAFMPPSGDSKSLGNTKDSF